jgi:hypothetical protein
MNFAVAHDAIFDGLHLKEIKMVLKDFKFTDLHSDVVTYVDGARWYTVAGNKEVGAWLRSAFADEEKSLWFSLGQANSTIERFDVHEMVHTQILLKFT